MGFFGELVPVVLALCLTVSGTNAQCGEQQQNAFLGCIGLHLFSFQTLAEGSSCNRKLITADLCKNGLCTNQSSNNTVNGHYLYSAAVSSGKYFTRIFATIVRCVNDINTTSTCRRGAITQMRNQMNFACKLNDLQETCTEAPALDTGEAIPTTMSSSKAAEVKTTESSAGKTMESTSVAEAESSFKGTGSAAVHKSSMVLLMMYKIMLSSVL